MQNIDYIKILAKFPKHCLWMLAVDGKFYKSENGPLGFDQREPGSVAKILEGLTHVIKHFDKPMSVPLISEVHKICMSNVKSENPSQPGKIRENGVGWRVFPEWLSKSGLSSMLKNKLGARINCPTRILIKSDPNKEPYHVSLIHGVIDRKKLSQYQVIIDQDNDLQDKNFTESSIEELYKKIQNVTAVLMFLPPIFSKNNSQSLSRILAEICKKYNSEILNCNNDNEKLRVILEFIQNVTQIHPYRDGNNRTFVNCFLNGLLIKNGLSPCVFFEPNIFESKTIPELIEIIKNYQKIFLNIIENPKEKVFDYDPNEIFKIEKGKYVQMGEKFKLDFFKNLYAFSSGYMKKKEYEQAINILKICFSLIENQNIGTSYKSNVLYCLAEAHFQLKQYEESFEYFNKSISLFNNNQTTFKLKSNDRMNEIKNIMNPQNIDKFKKGSNLNFN